VIGLYKLEWKCNAVSHSPSFAHLKINPGGRLKVSLPVEGWVFNHSVVFGRQCHFNILLLDMSCSESRQPLGCGICLVEL